MAVSICVNLCQFVAVAVSNLWLWQVGFVAVAVLLTPVDSAITAVFVLFAEDPQQLRVVSPEWVAVAGSGCGWVAVAVAVDGCGCHFGSGWVAVSWASLDARGQCGQNDTE
jgi:hypothetical protein